MRYLRHSIEQDELCVLKRKYCKRFSSPLLFNVSHYSHSLDRNLTGMGIADITLLSGFEAVTAHLDKVSSGWICLLLPTVSSHLIRCTSVVAAIFLLHTILLSMSFFLFWNLLSLRFKETSVLVQNPSWWRNQTCGQFHPKTCSSVQFIFFYK